MSPKFGRVKEKGNWNLENFNRLKQTADDKTLTMPPSAQVHSQEFNFKHFITHVFTKFIDAFVKEMIYVFSQLKSWSVFDILTLENFRRVLQKFHVTETEK